MRYPVLSAVVLAAACSGGDTTAPDAPPVASVQVTAPRPAIVPGDSVLLTAQAFDAAGRTVQGRAPSWSSSNPQAVAVSANGIARAIAEGDATITATIDGRSGSTTLAVRNVIAEEARRVSSPVGLGGDTLTVTSAGGITYSLEIPAGALEKPMTIAMTPVTDLVGAVFSGGVLGGLRLEPSGLRFLRPVRLKVSGFAPPSDGRVAIGFVARDDGGLETLVPSASVSGTLTLIVPHFSIIGSAAELPAALAGLTVCPAPCTAGAAIHQTALTLALAQNATRATINQTLFNWGRSIEVTELIPGLQGAQELVTAIVDYGLWITTIDFVHGLRADLAGFVADDPLSSQIDVNSDHMARALVAGVDRNMATCRGARSLAEAEVVLFWQEQAQALSLHTYDLPPAGGGGDLERAIILARLRNECFQVVLDTITLPEPLEIGKVHQVTTRFMVEFGGVTRQGAPFVVRFDPRDMRVSPDSGFTDLAGEFPASMEAEPAARFTGFGYVNATACLVLPTQAAMGALAKPSDICLTEPVRRAVLLYSNDFEGSVANEWTFTTTFTAPSGQQFLGELSNHSVLLTVDSVPALVTELILEVDLYIIASWNGNGELQVAGPPDIIEILADGASLLRTTFSNKPRDNQAYPGSFPGNSVPAGTGALALNALGYPPGPDFFGDAVYRLRLRFPHGGTTVMFNFNGNHTGQVERWGIDNVRIYAAN